MNAIDFIQVPQVLLKVGARGAAVGDLQRALVAAGCAEAARLAAEADCYGPYTEEAVRDFQSARGLPPSGHYGPLTRAALAEALRPRGTAPTLVPPTRALRPGDRHPAVAELRRCLVRFGVLQVADLGSCRYDVRMEQAVRQVQSIAGLPTSGVYGPVTAEVLRRLLGGALPQAA